MNIREFHWHHWTPHAGAISDDGERVRLSITAATERAYSDAQLDDYGIDGVLRWRPPVTLTLRARFGWQDDGLRGTAGFGWWNDPAGQRRRWPAPPRAIWFFHQSPPGRIELDHRANPHGWQAMTIDSSRWSFWALLPFAPLALPLMWHRWFRRALWPIGQWVLGVRQVDVAVDLREWHSYRIDWLPNRARFWVDDRLLLDTPWSPRGPLGLVLWIDNQYAVVTPGGHIGGGLLRIRGEQWLEIEALDAAG